MRRTAVGFDFKWCKTILENNCWCKTLYYREHCNHVELWHNLEKLLLYHLYYTLRVKTCFIIILILLLSFIIYYYLFIIIKGWVWRKVILPTSCVSLTRSHSTKILVVPSNLLKLANAQRRLLEGEIPAPELHNGSWSSNGIQLINEVN